MDPTVLPLDAPTLTARGPDDLLGYVGHALGTLPDRSLVLVTVAGARLRAVIRVDLPPPGPGRGAAAPRVPASWASAVAQVCRRDRQADGALGLLMDAGADPDAWSAPPWWRDLEAAAQAVGIRLLHGWVSTGRLAWPLDGGGSAAQAVDPGISDLGLQLTARGSVWGLRDDDLLVPEAGVAPGRWPPPDPADERARLLWLTDWEGVLTGGPAVPGPRLGAPLVLPAWRDLLILRAARRRADPGAEARPRERILTGRSAEPPDWRRLDRLWSACRAVAATAPAPQAAQALAVAGWVSWVRGHGGAAGAHLDAAARLTPADPFVRVLGDLVGAGVVAEWATDPKTAWRP